jgi:transposase
LYGSVSFSEKGGASMVKQRWLKGGVMSMERVREILRLKEAGYAQREIHRFIGVARSTIQEYLRTAAQHGLSYEKARALKDDELQALLCKKTPGRSRREVLEPDYSQIHAEYLSRKGVTLELLWQEWVSSTGGGYSYSTFNRRYREWAHTRSVTLRHEYRGGEKLFTDYAGERLSYWDEAGVEQPVEIFVAVLAASNRIFSEATKSQKEQCWIGSQSRALAFYGGVPEAIVPDNLKSAVTKADRYEPLLAKSYEEWAAHYGTTIIPARVRKPRDKGKVEKAVQDVERWILAPLRHNRFGNIDEINKAIAERLAELNSRPMPSYDGASRDELFERIDKAALQPLPDKPFIYAHWKIARVSLDYHIQLDHHYYSVPYRFARQEVAARVTEKVVEIFHNNERIASHQRSHTKFDFSTTFEHMPPEHKAVRSWTAESFSQWAKSVGPETSALTNAFFATGRHPEQGFRSILGLKRLAEKFGAQALEEATKLANARSIVSQRFVRQLLENRTASHTPLVHTNVRGSGYYH